MANQQHIGILKQGGNFWNTWRQRYPEILPDISNAWGVQMKQNPDSSWSDFCEDYPAEAKFGDICFSWIALSGADLRKTNLSGVDLRWANLGNANLQEANLSYANLS